MIDFDKMSWYIDKTAWFLVVPVMGELRAHAIVRIRNLNSYKKRFPLPHASPYLVLCFLSYFYLCRSNDTSRQKESKMTDRKAVIKNADMSEDMQQDAVDCATQAIEKYNIEKVMHQKQYSYPKIHIFFNTFTNLFYRDVKSMRILISIIKNTLKLISLTKIYSLSQV